MTFVYWIFIRLKFNKWRLFFMREIDLQIDDFMIECSTKGLSKRTINAYESTLRLLANYLERELGVVSANDVKQIHLKAYIRYLQERG